MDLIYDIFGEGKELQFHQMCARAVVIFLASIVLIRISGRRSFSMKSSFDSVIVILLGAVLSRAVVGVSPFFPILGASLTLVLLHRLFGWISIHNKSFKQINEGKKILLYSDGKLHMDNLKKCMVDYEDILEQLRCQVQQNDFHDVDTIYMEAGGKISIVKNGSKR